MYREFPWYICIFTEFFVHVQFIVTTSFHVYVLLLTSLKQLYMDIKHRVFSSLLLGLTSLWDNSRHIRTVPILRMCVYMACGIFQLNYSTISFVFSLWIIYIVKHNQTNQNGSTFLLNNFITQPSSIKCFVLVWYTTSTICQHHFKKCYAVI